MPSKGVQMYSHISIAGYHIEFSVPGQPTLVKTEVGAFGNDHLEIDKRHLRGAFNFTGQFKFQVTLNGSVVTAQYVNVNVLTGNLEGGSMTAMEDQLSYVDDKVIVTYLFYDAGTGSAGLPNSHQCLVTVSPNYSNWMGQAAIPGSAKGAKPFTLFFLPAVHDVGMNSMQTSDAVLQRAGSAFLNVLSVTDPTFSQIANSISAPIIQGIAPNIIAGLAITQKDRLETLLAVGARYFEFRPAYLHNVIRAVKPLEDELFFTHGPIPGMQYDEFLYGIVSFLLSQPAEIVVVQNRWDGVPAECARPSDDELNVYLNNALGRSDGAINAGSLDDMQHLTIDELRGQRKRLIIFRDANSLSTYDDKANATLDGDSIVAQFNTLSTEQQDGRPFTNLQCQATATNLRDVVIYSALTADVSNSCLLATKPICDSKTLPWIRDNALDRLKAEQMVCVMNDFFDGATANVCVELSGRRLDAAP